MKSIIHIVFILMAILLMNACQKDCPKGIQYSYKYYNISESVKQTFPYHFKDTQVWINVNTNDTLHYVLKDTVSSYDTTMVSPTDGCVQNNYFYSGIYSYKFNCLEDTFFEYDYSYRSYKGFGIDHYMKFNKIEYVEYGPILLDIDNDGINYKNIYVSKYFAENDSIGIVRITVGDVKLYRIK
jgi:hypothetical protein